MATEKNIITQGSIKITKNDHAPTVRGKIEWSLEQGPHGPCFSAMGSLREGGYECGGQCLEDLVPYLEASDGHDAKALRIIEIWRAYHLNDIKAGLPVQEKAIKGYLAKCKAEGKRYDFTEAINYLRAMNLYEIAVPAGAKCTGGFPADVLSGERGYRYGERWVYSAIPSSIIEEIKTWETEA